MRMSDVMSALGLAAFPIAAMALFLLVFAGVVVYAMRRSQKDEFDRAAMLPLSDGDRCPSTQKENGR